MKEMINNKLHEISEFLEMLIAAKYNESIEINMEMYSKENDTYIVKLQATNNTNDNINMIVYIDNLTSKKSHYANLIYRSFYDN